MVLESVGVEDYSKLEKTNTGGQHGSFGTSGDFLADGGNNE